MSGEIAKRTTAETQLSTFCSRVNPTNTYKIGKIARTLQSDGTHLDDNGFCYSSLSDENPIIGSRIDLTSENNTYTITNPGGVLAAKAVFGRSGNDTITGDSSADLIYGNRGLDSILGGTGNDTDYINPGDNGTAYYNDSSSTDYTDVLHVGADSSVSLLRDASTGSISNHTVKISGQTLTLSSNGESGDTPSVLGEGDRAEITIESGSISSPPAPGSCSTEAGRRASGAETPLPGPPTDSPDRLVSPGRRAGGASGIRQRRNRAAGPSERRGPPLSTRPPPAC